jgi:uncharacterized protein (DUF305 family)
MKITQAMLVMCLGSFIVQYFVMPAIMVSKLSYVTNHLGKAYLATIVALCTVLIEVAMHDMQYHTMSLNWYAVLGGLSAMMVYLYRRQIGINDREYVTGMIEHHAMALFTSDAIANKTDNYEVAKLAKNIIQQQTDELESAPMNTYL